mmetsp:Transcript_67653/g.112488  ORF Transcript_67653/g.112488 Transcript_67653/m.112488 type:complete len:109 (+) Transcript_67653:165-491(+)
MRVHWVLFGASGFGSLQRLLSELYEAEAQQHVHGAQQDTARTLHDKLETSRSSDECFSMPIAKLVPKIMRLMPVVLDEKNRAGGAVSSMSSADGLDEFCWMVYVARPQ